MIFYSSEDSYMSHEDEFDRAMVEHNILPPLYDDNPYIDHQGDSLDLSGNIKDIKERKKAKILAQAGKKKKKTEGEGETAGKKEKKKREEAVHSNSFIDMDEF